MTETNAALRVDELLAAARDKAGLHEFGDEWFLEPLGVLVAALNDEARLSELGLELTRRRLTALLVDRLRLRALQREHPEILDVESAVAAVICGLPRTGSTLLHRLLERADEQRATTFLEVRTDNEPAIAMYRAHGFEIVGLRKRYYQPSGADAHTMRRPPGGVESTGSAAEGGAAG